MERSEENLKSAAADSAGSGKGLKPFQAAPEEKSRSTAADASSNVQQQLKKATERCAELETELAQRDKKIGIMRSGISWRITHPLRAIGTQLARLFAPRKSKIPNQVSRPERRASDGASKARKGKYEGTKTATDLGEIVDISSLFDPVYYSRQNPDSQASGLAPMEHYLKIGWRKGRKPHLLFDLKYYLARNPEVRKTGQEPLSHYIQTGWKTGRNPHALFDVDWYRQQFPELEPMEPLAHYLREGWKKGCQPHPLFDTQWYLQKYSLAQREAKEPLTHFITSGWKKGFWPHPLFDTKSYLRKYPHVIKDGRDPLRHYMSSGWKAGCQPHACFDGTSYVKKKAGILPEGMSPLEHYIRCGHLEERSPSIEHSASEISPAQSTDYVVATRSEVASLLDKVSSANNTPYYRRLTEALSTSTNAHMLAAITQTIRSVDHARYGSIPKVGPFISVVMPVHNREGIVRESILSVLTQTYRHFELLICDDASDDDTLENIGEVADFRVRVIRHSERRGAAAARNSCLASSTGEYIAYLDSDNLWHPRYLEVMLEELMKWPGHLAAFASYIDIRINEFGAVKLLAANVKDFFLEDHAEFPYVDLNSFFHHRNLYRVFGGFDECLVRRQDYDLICRYCWNREPRHVALPLNIYQRIKGVDQITRTHRNDSSVHEIIRDKSDSRYRQGIPVTFPPWLKKITIVSWDMSRNHFAKAVSVAEALSGHLEVQLISFRFFQEPIFQPFAEMQPSFEFKSFEGDDFPDFFGSMASAVACITGDAIYAIKPRLTSFGLALLANYHTGKPIFLEVNDLETVVNSPRATDTHRESNFPKLFESMKEAVIPHSLVWSEVMEGLAQRVPVIFTHNINLDIHYDRRCLYMRNIKDDRLFDPAKINRASVREELGFSEHDRVILFGGLARRHKGVFQLVELLEKLADPRYKLLIVGNRETPDLDLLKKEASDAITILPPQPPERMAALNCAADLVVLWIDPQIPAGYYQSPYKMSDALAMGPAIIASPTSDQARFAEKDLMWMVPFGDFEALKATIDSIFADDAERKRRQRRARRFFLREFSYKSVAPALALGAAKIQEPVSVLPVAREFADSFSEFVKRCRAGIDK